MLTKFVSKSFYFVIIAALSLNAAVANTTHGTQNTTNDPYERLNRNVFKFNDFMDTYFLKPVATLYNKIVPKPLNKGIHNFYSNLGELHTIGNDVIQLHFAQSLNDMWRFAINSTIGVGGLFDVAERMQLPYYSNDFGLTFAHYGWVDSNYFVVPFWGPSTIRDTASMPVDYWTFEVYPYIYPYWKRYALYGIGVIDRRAQLLRYQSLFEAAAVDKYVFIRNAYLQRRRHEIEENNQLGFTGRANMPNDQEPVVAAG